MHGCNRALRFAAAMIAMATMLFWTLSPSQAQPRAMTGTVRLHIVKAGFIVGAGGGQGVLVFRGRRYPLSVGGIALGSLGIAAVDVVGTASNLRRPEDIAGAYAGAGAGGAFIRGGQVATLRNGNGVVLRLRGAQAGFQVSLGLGGMTISLR